MLNKLWPAFTIFILLSCPALAQFPFLDSENYTYTLGGKLSRGFILNGNLEIAHMTLSHPKGFEALAQVNTYGHQKWEAFFNYPDYGIGFNYQDLQNEMIGYSCSVFLFMDFYIWRGGRAEVFYHGGFGLSYISRPYERLTNNKNNLVTTHYNYYMQPRIGMNYRLSEQTKLTASLSLDHSSNGAYRKPNKGLNVIATEFGLLHRLSKSRPRYQNYIVTAPEIFPIRYNVVTAYGVRAFWPREGRYPVYTVQTYADMRLQPYRSLLAGLDFSFNTAHIQEAKTLSKHQNVPEDELPDFRQIGLMVGQEVFWDQVSFMMQIGIYLYQPVEEISEPIYQRIALKYNWKYKYSLQVALKTHYGSADSVEWGIGYRF